MSIGSLSNWLFNAIVAFTFLKLAWLFTSPGMEITHPGNNVPPDPNPAGAFIVYGVVALIGIIWGYYFIPETKNITLEEIEEHWRKGTKPNQIHHKSKV